MQMMMFRVRGVVTTGCSALLIPSLLFFIAMVLSRRSDQFHRDNTICGHLELFGLMACNETEELTATVEACFVLVLVDLR